VGGRDGWGWGRAAGFAGAEEAHFCYCCCSVSFLGLLGLNSKCFFFLIWVMGLVGLGWVGWWGVEWMDAVNGTDGTVRCGAIQRGVLAFVLLTEGLFRFWVAWFGLALSLFGQEAEV
jgi:hypothetical protein